MSSTRELERELHRAGFAPEWGRGSHRKWRHPSGEFVVLKSNCAGRDACPGARHDIRRAIERASKGTEQGGRACVTAYTGAGACRHRERQGRPR